jgi:hypothetical protein
MGFEITGLEELEKQLNKAIRKAPKEFKKLKDDIKDLTFKNTAKHVPSDKGQLKAAFEKQLFRGKKEYVEEDLSKEAFAIGTDVWYAHMIENGHKLKGGKGFKQGVKFMEKGLEETAREIPAMERAFIERVLGGIT